MKVRFCIVLWIFSICLCWDVSAQDWSLVQITPGNWGDVNFNDICFAEGRGWAVGKNGTIITYNGVRWSNQISGVQTDLHGVYFVNALEGWAVGDSGVILRTEDGGINWKRQAKANNLYDVYFIDNRHGWAVGALGTVYRTDDGNTWMQIPVEEKFKSYAFLGVYFFNFSNGWVVGENGTILYWNGTKWQEQQSNTPEDLYGVYFTSTVDGWVVGDRGVILYTDNGWIWRSGKSRAPATYSDLRSVYFRRSQDIYYGWIVGEDGTNMYTWDGGRNWFMGSVITSNDLNAVYALSISEVWAVGNWGVILRSTDRGVTWGFTLNPPYGNFWDVSFRTNLSWGDLTPQLDGWIVGDRGVLLKSDSAGWHENPSPTDKTLYGICMVSKYDGWAVGEAGTVIRTRDGIKWELEPPITTRHLRGVHFNFTGFYNGWVVGDEGTILHWDGEYRTWALQISSTTANLNGVCSLNKNEAWTVGDLATILHTTDGGRNWDKVEADALSSKPTVALHSVYFANSDNGWIVGDGGTILYWHEGEFTEQDSNTSWALYDVDFADASVGSMGWIAGADGTILSTVNGGKLWQPSRLPSAVVVGNLYGIDFANQNNGFAVGENSSVIKYISFGPPTSLELIAPRGDVTSLTPAFIWKTNKPNVEHTIFIDTDTDPFQTPLRSITVSGSSTGYVLDTPLPRGTYYWGMGLADGTRSEVVQFKVWPQTQVTLISPSGYISDASPTLRWDCSNKDLESINYILFIDDDDTPYDTDGILVGRDLSYKYIGLTEGKYSWGVQTADGAEARPPMKFIIDLSEPTGTVDINDGARFTNSLNVTLRLTASDLLSTGDNGSGVAQMKFSNDNSNWSDPEPFAGTKSWDLSLYGGNTGDGLKTVYVQYKDNLGHWMTNSASDEITVDRVPPTGTISINDGAEFTGPGDVTLSLSASDDASGVENGGKMRLSNGGNQWTDILPYLAKRDWNFKVYGGTEDEGVKTVYVKYMDAAGNWMDEPASDTIKLDKTGPTGTIVINSGAEYTGSLLVNLTLSASDGNGSGVKFMQFTNGGGIWSHQEPYSFEKGNWDLSQSGGSSEQGEKTVFVRFVDAVGNISAQSAYDSIIFKKQITASIQISSPRVQGRIKNNDVVSVSGKSEPNLVEAIFDVLDESGNSVTTDLTGVRYNVNTGQISGSFNVGILAAESIKLMVRLKDKPGNQGEFLSNSLAVDNVPPSNLGVSIDQGGLVNSLFVDLTISATDALEMYVDGDVKDQGKWITYATTLKVSLTEGDGIKAAGVKFRDDIGNESTEVSARTILDTTPPVGTIVINNGESLTKSYMLSLTLSASDANGVAAYQLSNDESQWPVVSPWPATAGEFIRVDEWDLQEGRYGGNDTEGLRTVYVQYQDKAGNWSNAFSDDIQVSVKAPNISLQIVKDRQEAMEPVTITAVIKSSGRPITVANLHYARKGSGSYITVPMISVPGPGDYYKAEIPGSEVTLAGVDYYLSAGDGLWTSRRPEEGASIDHYSFTVVDTKPPIIEHEPVSRVSVKNSPKITARVTDKVEVKNVRLFYKPASDKDFIKVDMVPGVAQGEYSANIPALDIIGRIEYYIEAIDSSSNTGIAPPNGKIQPYIISFVDTEPPVIAHTRTPDGQEAGKPVVIGATITDNLDIREVLLKYRNVGKTDYVEVKMTRVGSYFSVEIPASVMTPGVIEYWITASDSSPDSDDVKVSYSFTVVDTTPPSIEITFVPSQVEVHKSISVEAKVTDNVKVEAVSLYYKGTADAPAAAFSVIDMKGVGNKYSATIPEQKQAGMVKFYIYARDSQGVSATEPGVDPQNRPRVITVLDTSKPVIDHSPVMGVQEAGIPVTVTATVKDDVRVAEVSLHYRTMGQVTFKMASMLEKNSSSVYSGSIPGSDIVLPGMEYYIKAVDDSANITTHPAANPDTLPHSFRVADTVPPDIVYDPSALEKILINEPIVVTMKTTDLAGIKESLVFYKNEGETSFNSLTLKYIGEDKFSATIPSPLAKGNIFYYIQAEDNSGNISTSPKENPKVRPYSVFVDDPFPPLPPARLIANSAPGGRVILSWELSRSPDTYKYNIYTDKGSGTIDYSMVYDSVTTSTWESPPLGEGTYKFIVRAVDRSGNEESNTSSVSAIADATKPEPVTNLIAASISGGRIQLKWTLSLSRDAAVYNIYWDNAQANIDYSSPLARVNDPGSTWVSGSLKDGVVYRFVVRCQDHAGNEEGNTNFVSARADNTPPGNVTGLFSSTHKINVWSNQVKVTVSWNAAADTGTGLGGYSIIWDELERTLPDETIDIGAELTEASSVQAPASGTQYFHIRSVDKAGNWSNAASHLGPFLIDTQPPQPPTSHEASPQADGRIKLGWKASASTDVVSYNIYWDSGTGRGIDYSNLLAQTTSAVLAWTSDALEDGRTYQFGVRAEDRAGNEEKNVQRSTGVADSRPPSVAHIPIAGVLEQDIEDVLIEADVNDSSGLDNVKLYYRKHGEPGYKEVEMELKPNTSTFIGGIPASAISSAGVDYYISATDTAGNISKYPVVTIDVSSDLKIPVESSDENKVLVGNSLTINFPAGSVTADANLNVTVPRFIPEPQEGLKKHIFTREISLDKELRKSVKLALTYSDEKVADEDETKLALYLWDGQKWNYITNVDPKSNQANVTTMRLGIFSIIGDYEPPAVDDLQPSGYAERNFRITARLRDGGSGVDPKSIQVQIKGENVTVTLRFASDIPTTALEGETLSFALPGRLETGSYSMKITVRDNVRNQAEAASEFHVAGELALVDVYCYPNPFKPSQGVHFSYTLTESVKNVTIRIFGMDGKLVRKIDGTTQIGENSVLWDCLDEAGDLALNSVFICYIEAEGSKTTVKRMVKIAGWE